jgi:general secretion pathway protein N
MKIQFERHAFNFSWLCIFITSMALLIVLSAQFPINWLAKTFSQKTACKVVLVQPTGTIWEGSTSFGFSEFKIGDVKTCSAPDGMTERFSWNSHCSLLDLVCKWNIQHANLERSLELALSPTGLTIGANKLELPGNLLEGLGSPWNSLHPRGKLKIHWSVINWGSIPTGLIEIQFVEISSPISLIKPLGSYAIKIAVDHEVKFDLITLSGPLLLKGNGQLANGKLSFQGEASALTEAKESLTGLLSIIGRRDGAIYRLKM